MTILPIQPAEIVHGQGDDPAQHCNALPMAKIASDPACSPLIAKSWHHNLNRHDCGLVTPLRRRVLMQPICVHVTSSRSHEEAVLSCSICKEVAWVWR